MVLIETIKDNSGKVIATLLKQDGPCTPVMNGTTFVTGPEHSLQLGLLERLASTKVAAHQHNPVTKEVIGCQEILIVISGLIAVKIYDAGNEWIAERLLRTGDVYMQYFGGHSFEFIHDTRFYEIKQGPYAPSDKVYFNPLAHEQTK
jgi:hypothetical protein